MRLFLKPQTAQSFDIKIESPEAFHFDLLILPFRSANESIKNQILFSARSNTMVCRYSRRLNVPAEVIVHLDVKALPVRSVGQTVRHLVCVHCTISF